MGSCAPRCSDHTRGLISLCVCTWLLSAGLKASSHLADDLAHDLVDDLADDLALADNVPGLLQPEQSERRLPVTLGRREEGREARGSEVTVAQEPVLQVWWFLLSFPECPAVGAAQRGDASDRLRPLRGLRRLSRAFHGGQLLFKAMSQAHRRTRVTLVIASPCLCHPRRGAERSTVPPPRPSRSSSTRSPALGCVPTGRPGASEPHAPAPHQGWG